MNKLKQFREDLHKIPEIGNHEFKTKEYLKNVLTNLGYHPVDILQTGLYVYIDNNNTETIAFRSDMDALQTTEENDVPYSSTHEGYMHACGHDGHMSMLLGLADYLKDKQEQLTKNILLIFQPAEESIGGAKRICETNLFNEKNVVNVYGIHLYPGLDEGVLGSKSGPFMASVSLIDIEVFGTASHGAMPEHGVDANLILSKLLIDFQSVQTRNVSPTEKTILTFGVMQGGDVRNTLSDYATMSGTLRTYDRNVFTHMKKRIETICSGYELAYGCTIKATIDEGYLSVNNDETLYNEWKEHLQDFPLHEFKTPLMIAEDFSFYQQEAPGLFYYVGTRNETDGYIHSLHSNKFNFNSTALEVGLQSYITLLQKSNIL